ncbi:hypothetical protein KIN_22050 [Litoreibacter roseus]|uniref:Uncharacterized protein n=1 Tax=Litoreibacter roseus TaxID=2601869 RepID=A0A6N6JFK4_9RHOB|nr:hypothetical protein KIN_22050 [Litoreibacter roseus]
MTYHEAIGTDLDKLVRQFQEDQRKGRISGCAGPPVGCGKNGSITRQIAEFEETKDLESAIKIACWSRKIDGKKHPHQFRVPNKSYVN